LIKAGVTSNSISLPTVHKHTNPEQPRAQLGIEICHIPKYIAPALKQKPNWGTTVGVYFPVGTSEKLST
jgi:hypothetical protein